MTEPADKAVDRAAEKLEGAAEAARERSVVPDAAAEELRGDAAFLRQLKPSLIMERLRGLAPTDGAPGGGRTAPFGPQLGRRGDGGPNPFLVVAGAFVIGVVLAKLIDWRGHAHPRF